MAVIVIVEDDVTVGGAYASVLRDRGHNVTLCADVTEADAVVANEIVDLVLLDLWLPDIGGLDYLKTLAARKRPPKIVVVSGGGHGRSLESAFTIAELRGAITTLTKPVTDDELAAAVETALAD